MKTVGSLCSGIEAASVAWKPLGLTFEWFSEIAEFPSEVLQEKYPHVPNVGDMTLVPNKIATGELTAPDILCAGTPCQAFSYAGWKKGLGDERGNLTLQFVDTVEANDRIRLQAGLPPSVIFWENVEGVLRDKTNAFGHLISSLAGLAEPLHEKRWPNAGLLRGPKRNVAWRVLDAKYFGLPQQRKRVYLVAGGKTFHPEDVLFEVGTHDGIDPQQPLETFEKEGAQFQVFREYTDCLYASYGTKWNGNAAAYNGSLFVEQNEKIRRLSPLECERLMGFPDHYTKVGKALRTPRYQALGNSWAVPVIAWLGRRMLRAGQNNAAAILSQLLRQQSSVEGADYTYYNRLAEQLGEEGDALNSSVRPNETIVSTLETVIDANPPQQIYISPVGCQGILRRKEERDMRMNERLERSLAAGAQKMSAADIEKISRQQKRGEFSKQQAKREEVVCCYEDDPQQLSFDLT